MKVLLVGPRRIYVQRLPVYVCTGLALPYNGPTRPYSAMILGYILPLKRLASRFVSNTR